MFDLQRVVLPSCIALIIWSTPCNHFLDSGSFSSSMTFLVTHSLGGSAQLLQSLSPDHVIVCAKSTAPAKPCLSFHAAFTFRFIDPHLWGFWEVPWRIWRRPGGLELWRDYVLLGVFTALSNTLEASHIYSGGMYIHDLHLGLPAAGEAEGSGNHPGISVIMVLEKPQALFPAERDLSTLSFLYLWCIITGKTFCLCITPSLPHPEMAAENMRRKSWKKVMGVPHHELKHGAKPHRD